MRVPTEGGGGFLEEEVEGEESGALEDQAVLRSVPLFPWDQMI